MVDIVILNDLAEAKGGASALALFSALAFRKRNLSVSFLAGDRGSNPALTEAGVGLHALGGDRLTSSSTVSAFANGLYNRAAAQMVRRWIGENDTPETIYHLHGWAQILSPAVFGALWPVRRRLVLSAHDFFLACPNGSFSFLKSGSVCPYRPLTVACIASNCDRRNYAHKLWRVGRQLIQRRLYHPETSPPVLAIHPAMRPFLMRAGIPDSAIITLPNPVEPLTRERIPAEANHELIFIGRVEDTKGPDLALRAARLAGARLRVVGEGARRPALERTYPEALFTGFLNRAGIAEHARHARLMLMPSRYPEPFGLAAVEALWSGLPVIAAQTAFVTNEIVEAGAGMGRDPRAVEEFADVLRGLMRDDRTVETMSRNAFERTAHIALRPDQWVDRLIEIYEQRLAAARGSSG